MPVKESNVVEEALEFYKGMIDHCVTDVPLGNGMYRPDLNLSKLVERTRAEHKAAQVLVQLLSKPRDNVSADEREKGLLHASWVMAGLILAFGPDSPAVQWPRQVGPQAYEAAVVLLRNVK
jgi:hypothetical protein